MSKIIKILSQLTQQKLVFPFYHAVANEIPLHLKHLYSVRSRELFKSDLRFFLSSYKALSINRISDTQKKNKGFCITFDDGLREFKEIAWPILKEVDIPVVLFVNPAFVDNNDLFYRFKASLLIEHLSETESVDLKTVGTKLNQEFLSVEELVAWINAVKYGYRNSLDKLAHILDIDFNDYLDKHQPYLTLDELKELQSEGVHIGAHSMDHPLFNQLSMHDQLKQIKESVNWINSNFDQDLSAFSFPFTDFGLKKELFDQIYNHPEFKLDLTFGTAGIKREKFPEHIQRIPMENNLKSAKQILLGEYLYYLAKVPLLKNTIRR